MDKKLREFIRNAKASRQTRYTIELWSRTGTPIADITPFCRNLYWVEERNEAEALQFSLDLDAFEDYMINKAGADPVSNFRAGQTEIKVRENGDYLFGTQLFYDPIDFANDGSLSISVQATGYLNFFNDRYPDPNVAYTNTEAVEIFYSLVDQAQEVEHGDYGIITRPEGYYTTDKNRDRTFENYTSSTKLNMQRLTNLVDGNFDFKFLADKRLMTYASIGSPRTDFSLTYDRQHYRSTFDTARINRGANNLYNLVHGIGSGFGEDAIFSHQGDETSQLEFGLREAVVQFSEVKNQSTLDENTLARLERVKQLLRMPQITLSGADMPAVRLEVGDIIPVIMKGRRHLEDLTGFYRVERKESHVDDNHFLKAVTLFFEKTGDYGS